MFSSNKMDHVELRTRAKQLLSAYFSNRKLLLGTVGLLLVLLFFFPSWFGLGSKHTAPDASYFCLENQLGQYSKLENEYQVRIKHHPVLLDHEKPYSIFSGNGNIGVAFGDDDQQIRISSGRVLDLPIGLHPLVSANVRNSYSLDAYIVEYLSGTVKKLQCHMINSECVIVTTNVYVHRKYPNVLVQEITIRNPLGRSLELNFNRPTCKWQDRTTKTIGSGRNSVEIVSRSLTLSSDTRVVAISALLVAVPGMVAVKPHGSESYRFLSIIDFSEPTNSDQIEERKKTIKERVLQTYDKVSAISPTVLDKEHEVIWHELWRPTFVLSYSRAPDTLNPDLINATKYAVLSNTPAPLHEVNLTEEKQKTLMAAFKQNELCYSSHNTLLYPSKLWSDMSDVDSLVSVARAWRLTLEKHGCINVVSAGADGISQAMALSFGGLKFSHHHLEFGTHPSELHRSVAMESLGTAFYHRDFEFRNIEFGDHFINIFVQLGADNRAQLFASVTPKQKNAKLNFFACDAGCLDAPVHLGPTRALFPVKLTDPVTAILYIAADRSHIEELKETIHVKEVGEAPAHEHHVIALHRHGHRLGGLPTLFWVALGFLIITFHLFLFKLVYSEWKRTNDKPYSRGRYSM